MSESACVLSWCELPRRRRSVLCEPHHRAVEEEEQSSEIHSSYEDGYADGAEEEREACALLAERVQVEGLSTSGSGRYIHMQLEGEVAYRIRARSERSE